MFSYSNYIFLARGTVTSSDRNNSGPQWGLTTIPTRSESVSLGVVSSGTGPKCTSPFGGKKPVVQLLGESQPTVSRNGRSKGAEKEYRMRWEIFPSQSPQGFWHTSAPCPVYWDQQISTYKGKKPTFIKEHCFVFQGSNKSTRCCNTDRLCWGI